MDRIGRGTRRRTGTRIATGAAGVLLIGALGACSAPPPDAASEAVGATPGSGGAYSGAAASGTVSTGTPVSADARNGVAVVDPLPAQDAAAPTARIRTAELDVRVSRPADVPAKADAATRITLRAGGEVAADDRSGGDSAQADLTLRVPPAALAGTLRDLAALGRVQSRQQSSQDVTQKVADVGSRTASAQQAIARLRTLYARADKVADVLSIEGELDRRQADLESLLAQQRALARQTELASITLRLSAQAPAAKPTHHSGFVGGLSRGWDAFTGAVAAVVTGVGVIVPFAALGLVLAALVALLVAVRRRRGTTPPTEGSAAA